MLAAAIYIVVSAERLIRSTQKFYWTWGDIALTHMQKMNSIGRIVPEILAILCHSSTHATDGHRHAGDKYVRARKNRCISRTLHPIDTKFALDLQKCNVHTHARYQVDRSDSVRDIRDFMLAAATDPSQLMLQIATAFGCRNKKKTVFSKHTLLVTLSISRPK